jgi:hypothetical protein
MAVGSPRQLLGFWKDRTPDEPSEFSWGPGLVPPSKETAPPSRGGMYRGKCPPVELTRSPDLSVRARPAKPQPGDPPPGYPGEQIAR